MAMASCQMSAKMRSYCTKWQLIKKQEEMRRPTGSPERVCLERVGLLHLANNYQMVVNVIQLPNGSLLKKRRRPL